MDAESVKDSTKGLSLKTAIEHYKELVAEQGDVVKTEGIRTMSSKAKPNKKYVMFKKAYRSETDKDFVC